MPNTDFSKTIEFFAQRVHGEAAMADLFELNRKGWSTRRNSPQIDRIELRSVAFTTSNRASVTTCETDNYISIDGGPDRAAGTSDDVIDSEEVGSRVINEEWVYVDRIWMRGQYSESEFFELPSCPE